MDLLAWIRTSSRRRRRGFDEKEKVDVDHPGDAGDAGDTGDACDAGGDAGDAGGGGGDDGDGGGKVNWQLSAICNFPNQ